MKTKLLFSLCLFCSSFLAYADGGVKYSLLNNSIYPVPNPIKVTGGYISYYFYTTDGSKLPAHCPDYQNLKTVDLGPIADLPLPVYRETASKFTFTMDPSMQDCFTGTSTAWITLVITNVDSITKQDGVCAAMSALQNYNDNTYTNMSIQETSGKDASFYCTQVGGVRK